MAVEEPGREPAGERESTAETGFGPVRVRGAVAGDRLLLRIVHSGRNALWGEIVDIVEPSPERVEPRCRVFAWCGGCPWQAWDLKSQRIEKAARLEKLLAGIPGARPEPVRGSAEHYGYRAKIMVVAGGRAGSLKFGLYAPRSHDLVPSTECAVQDPAGRRIVESVRAVLNASRMPPFNEGTGRGVFKRLLVRIAPGTGQAGVVLVTTVRMLRGAVRTASSILSIPGVRSVWANHCPGGGPDGLGEESSLLAGQPRIEARVGGASFLLTPTSFFQTNSGILPMLLEAVGEALPSRMKHLVDLYSGAGLFTLSFAPRAGRVTAVEANPPAALDLQASAKLMRLRNIEIARGDAAGISINGPAPDAVILDPPRAGVHPSLIERITREWKPGAIAYVSCAPETLARDLKLFSLKGYRATRIVPLDMFPHTPHLETVAALERKR